VVIFDLGRHLNLDKVPHVEGPHPFEDIDARIGTIIGTGRGFENSRFTACDGLLGRFDCLIDLVIRFRDFNAPVEILLGKHSNFMSRIEQGLLNFGDCGFQIRTTPIIPKRQRALPAFKILGFGYSLYRFFFHRSL